MTNVLSGRARTVLGAVLFAGFALRAAYVLAQPSTDPTFAAPMLDGAVYLDWARGLVRGEGEPAGAFYLAPLYPHLLAAFLAVAGERFELLYLLQQALAVAAAGALGLVAARHGGAPAAIAASALTLSYRPLLFFASRPMGEVVALAVLAFALLARTGILAGALAAAGALARPNLLVVPVLWAAGEARARRWWRAGALVLGSALVVAPVAMHNLAASGHLVLVSSNGGITLYHGNGPGAMGVFTPPEGLSGEVVSQREEATALASEAVGRELDPVAADRWWRRQAVAHRLEHPGDTLRLGLWRLLLLLDRRELGLDYAPSLDQNPWRWAAPLPFPVLLGLAVLGVGREGLARTGGWRVWSTIGATAAAPLLFYASSRYRLPFAVLLVLPAGIGVGSVVAGTVGRRRAVLAAAAAVLAALGSIAVPSGRLARAAHAGALSNRAAAHKAAGDLERALADARAAVRADAGSATAWFNLGAVREAAAETAAAEAAYRRALGRDPALAEAAGNLGGLLVRRGRADLAIPVLRRALERRPRHAVCWTNLVVALASTGDVRGARAAAEQARARGVSLDPDLLRAIAGGAW